jgi:hypothetical protein
VGFFKKKRKESAAHPLAAFGSAGTPLVPSLSGYVDEKRKSWAAPAIFLQGTTRSCRFLSLKEVRRQKKEKRNQEEDLLWKMLEPSKFVHDPKQHRRAITRAS